MTTTQCDHCFGVPWKLTYLLISWRLAEGYRSGEKCRPTVSGDWITATFHVVKDARSVIGAGSAERATAVPGRWLAATSVSAPDYESDYDGIIAAAVRRRSLSPTPGRSPPQ